MSIEWITAVKVWAREQAASAPPLSAEAARIVCSALTRETQKSSSSPVTQFERQMVTKNNPEGSRQVS
jgi:hypothetical protein